MRPIGAVVSVCLFVGGLSCLRPGTVRAQSGDAGTPWIVTVSHWGKWPALAGAGTLIALAVVRNHEAGDARDELQQYCADDPRQCAFVPGPGGELVYGNPQAEALFQTYAGLNRKAKRYLAGGQVSLLVTGAMFLIDLVYQRDGYDNIPYTPLEVYSTPNRLGFTVRF